MFKTPEQWCMEKDIYILDPDGWRMADAPSWDTPISEDDFMSRYMVSTAMSPRPAWMNS